MHDVVQGKTRRRTPSDDKGIEKKRSADRERQRKRLQKMTTQELSEYRASQCAKALKQRQSMTQEDKALAAIRRHKNYMDNHDHQKATHREWHLRNKDSVLVLQKKWREGNIPRILWLSAKHRAKKRGVYFSLTPDDIIVPERCPILGVVLELGRGKVEPNSPTLDRVDPSVGYIRGNVAVMSHRANLMKGGMTAAEPRSIADWMEGYNA